MATCIWAVVGRVDAAAASEKPAAGAAEASAPSPAAPEIAIKPEAKPGPAEPAEAAKPDAKPGPARQAGPTQAEAEQWFAKGREALFQGKYDVAIELLSKATAADKSKTSYHLSLARAYRFAGKDDLAIGELEQVLKTAPDHV
jgi:tetratricopeptide (TPR) repeat protein